MDLNSKIYVAGHNGLVGSAVLRKLRDLGYRNLVTRDKVELNLLSQRDVFDFFKLEKIDFVFLCAAKVGGIHANDVYRADFIYENLTIQNNVIWSANSSGVKKLLFLGSSCIYPKFAKQPITEAELLSGYLEDTNEAYAVAKIAGLILCKSISIQYNRPFISLMPTNLYGPNDNYHPENSHVIPSLIRRFHEAKVNNSSEVIVWGSGRPLREFLYVDDLAEACVFAMNNYSGIAHLNVGSGDEVSIRELAECIADVIQFDGKIVWDTGRPDGTPRKLMDSNSIRSLGWVPKEKLQSGLEKAYADFLFRIGKSGGPQ